MVNLHWFWVLMAPQMVVLWGWPLRGNRWLYSILSFRNSSMAFPAPLELEMWILVWISENTNYSPSYPSRHTHTNNWILSSRDSAKIYVWKIRKLQSLPLQDPESSGEDKKDKMHWKDKGNRITSWSPNVQTVALCNWVIVYPLISSFTIYKIQVAVFISQD